MDENFSGKLNRRISIYANVKTGNEDEIGEPEYADTEIRRVWGEIIPQTGTQITGRAADTMLTQTSHKIRIRYRKDISKDMWIMYDGIRYDILYILDPYQKHELLEIFCKVVQS